MKYYSTNHQSPVASLEEAVVKGLASDKGLFMPEAVKMLPEEFYDNIEHLSFQEIAYRVADAFFGEVVPADTSKQIVYDTLSFDVPAVKVKEIYTHWNCFMVLPWLLRTWADGSWLVCWVTSLKKKGRSR